MELVCGIGCRLTVIARVIVDEVDQFCGHVEHLRVRHVVRQFAESVVENKKASQPLPHPVTGAAVPAD